MAGPHHAQRDLAAVGDEDAGHFLVTAQLVRLALVRLALVRLALVQLALVRLAVHHRRPDGEADRLVTLVDAAVLERHDAGAGPGPGPPGLQDVGGTTWMGVPGEHRRREVHPGEAEVGDGGPEGQLMDGQADDQRPA